MRRHGASTTELITAAQGGDRRSLARLITLVENGGPTAERILQTLFPSTGRAHIVGVTGAPGTGKSTLVNAMAREYRNRGLTVGIIAIDPTSPFSGGALLGDRVRMRDLVGDEGVFIRSMATRGSLGGLARATDDVIQVLDAMGFDRILVETVGVGQAEVDIASSAHTVIVVEAPGLGDDIQAIKAGILEIADIFVVNKADREGAERTVMALQAMLGLGPRTVVHHGQTMRVEEPGGNTQGWTPPIIKTVATRGEGVPELVQAVEAHRAYLMETGELRQREEARVTHGLEQILREALVQRLVHRISPQALDQTVQRVLAREVDPYTAVEELLHLEEQGEPQAAR
ncbi:MAG: methylmalonyl Co-A mutase-associated GTPase MeaB [Chloroflexi bacterium]|nr:methylmalonyl Co-A mutase-associated GTPase MeaB [Chloroflexota bacterium]